MTHDLIKEIGYKNFVSAVRDKMTTMPGVLGKNPFPLKHSFAEGLYIREIFIPKGHLCIGGGHYDSYVNFVVSGDMSIITEEGVNRVKGPQMIVSPAGSQRMGYSHEDTVWVTVHANVDNERDLDILDKRLHYDDYVPAEKIEDNLEVKVEELCHLS